MSNNCMKDVYIRALLNSPSFACVNFEVKLLEISIFAHIASAKEVCGFSRL